VTDDMPRFSPSDHHNGERFFNPHGDGARSLAEVFKWQRTRERAAWPERVPLEVYPPPPDDVPPGRIAVTFIGHATFLLRTAAALFVTDPVFTTHAGPFGRIGPRRVRAPGCTLDQVPPADVVLVSHNHYDHLQPSSLRALDRHARPWYLTGLGNKRLLSSTGLRQVDELDWWDAIELGPFGRVTCVPAQHFSARTPWDRDRTLWAGFVVESAGATVYFAGDTGYAPLFEDIGRRFPRIDLALIPIGAYEPRWFMRPVHVNPEEAVRIHRDVGARRSIGMHFGTFHLTDEAIDAPLIALEHARREAGVSDDDFPTIGFGETVIV
jgi:L-ascorbate metabolism protein UlaG (beta-lactamase superfamily)